MNTVNLGRLAKTIRREAKANPKKAALLGLLLVVAVYFWMPLVAGWFTQKNAEPSLAAAQGDKPPVESMPGSAPSSGPTATSALTGAAAQKAVPQPPWQDLVQWMDQDPRTMPAGRLLLERDPFLAPRVERPMPRPKALSAQVDPELKPQDLAFVLSGTVVGADRHVARINGKSYEQGKTIALSAKDGKQQWTFRLAEVEARRVVLERQGKRYEVKIEPGGRPGPVVLLGSVP